MGYKNLNSETRADRIELKGKVVSKTRYWGTWVTTSIRKLIASPYDIVFTYSRSWIKASNVGFDMGWKNRNSRTRAERSEWKGKLVLKTRSWGTWATTCIKKLIPWSYGIGFSSARSRIKAYDVGYDMGQNNPNSETGAERNDWKGKVNVL